MRAEGQGSPSARQPQYQRGTGRSWTEPRWLNTRDTTGPRIGSIASMSDDTKVPNSIALWLTKQEGRLGLKLVITDVDRYPDCQVYSWTSAAAAAGSSESQHLIAGGGPLIVDSSGNLWETGSAYPIETWLADFRGPRRLVRPLRSA